MTQTLRFIPALLLAFICSNAFAVEVSITEKIDIAASPAAVWAVSKDFGNLHRWHPAFVGSTNSNGNNLGSVRVVDLGGPTITEELVRFNEEHRNFTYKITQVDPSVLPVENYIAWFAVRDNGNGGSSVTWMGNFNTVGDAPAADVEKGVTGVYRAGLDNLKAMLETPAE
ncbi:MAG: SRPBCC family protein [Porticoccaceae bacterium]|nr:SRPBCC family protein [Porticoccaceae bacterium]